MTSRRIQMRVCHTLAVVAATLATVVLILTLRSVFV
jgi:hypothetical protein